jgi:hypothetical protein
LLVYPSTLAHYAIYLVVPLLLLWRRQESRGGEWVVIAFMALVGLVTGIAHGRYAFWAIAATWLAFVLHPLASETSTSAAPLPSADGTAP